MSASDLQYEPAPQARPVLVEHDGDTTRIIVPMPGLYVPVPGWVYEMDVLTLIALPIAWVATLVVRTALRHANPPRAIFEITPERLKLHLVDPSTGAPRESEWPRSAIVEARANRFERGLWMDIAGHIKSSFLADLPRATIQRLDEALNAALKDSPARPV